MTILIIEENITLLNSMKRILNHHGYEVDITHDGINGLNQILNKHYDLIILDLNLHHISAKDILNTTYMHNIKTPFIALTKKEILSIKLLNYELVTNEYLVLPFRTKSLLYKIEKTIELSDYCYLNKGILIENFAFRNNNKKQYLTTTEILIIKEIADKEFETTDNLLKIVPVIEDLWIYIDSINLKLKKVGYPLVISYQNRHYRLEELKNGK